MNPLNKKRSLLIKKLNLGAFDPDEWNALIAEFKEAGRVVGASSLELRMNNYIGVLPEPKEVEVELPWYSEAD